MLVQIHYYSDERGPSLSHLDVSIYARHAYVLTDIADYHLCRLRRLRSVVVCLVKSEKVVLNEGSGGLNMKGRAPALA